MEKFIRNPRTAWREYDGQVMVITPDDSKLHTLNESGSFLWKSLGEDGDTQDGLVAKLLEEFEVTQEEAKKDTKAFLKLMVEKQLAVRNQAS